MRKFSEVKKGSTGTDVIVLQSMLRALQYVGANGKPLDIDGECGANTIYAINEFQTRQRAYGIECGNKGKNTSIFNYLCWSRLLGI